MDWKQRIVMDPAILVGKPIIRNTRIAVEFILELLSNGWTENKILENYPQLTMDDIIAAIKYAVEVLKEEKIYIPV